MLDAALAATRRSWSRRPRARHIADRAGYPVLTLPAGYGVRDSSTGGDPIGLVLIGAAGSGAGAAQRRLRVRAGAQDPRGRPAVLVGTAQFEPRAPAPRADQPEHVALRRGSAFYHPYACNAGEIGTPLAAGPAATAVDGRRGRHRAGDALALSRRAGDFGAFTPGVAKDYTAATTANVISTAGDAALRCRPRPPDQRRFSLPEPLRSLLEVDLDRPGLQRPGHDRLQAAHRCERPAPHGGVHEDADVHPVDDDPVHHPKGRRSSTAAPRVRGVTGP